MNRIFNSGSFSLNFIFGNVGVSKVDTPFLSPLYCACVVGLYLGKPLRKQGNYRRPEKVQ